MGRQRSARVADIKQRLLSRLQAGVHRPGERFLSSRAVANRFEISYQTAHRLIQELTQEGHLVRQPASGTFVAGERHELCGVQLIFAENADAPGSMGRLILDKLIASLERAEIDYQLSSTTRPVPLPASRFPVVWENPWVADVCARQGRGALLMNAQPPMGRRFAQIDSVDCNEFAGGVFAAELLLEHVAGDDGFVIMAARDSVHAARRVEGFQSIVPATVVNTADWPVEHGYRAAPMVARLKPRGVFCCADRLAAGLLQWYREQELEPPGIVGFDNAALAERLDLTTIAGPWDTMVAGAVEIIRRRLGGDNSAGCTRLYTPQPVVRSWNPRPLVGD